MLDGAERRSGLDCEIWGVKHVAWLCRAVKMDPGFRLRRPQDDGGEGSLCGGPGMTGLFDVRGLQSRLPCRVDTQDPVLAY